MEVSEWRELVQDINSDIAAISRAVQTRGEIHDQIAARAVRPNEEFFIDDDAFGMQPSEPREFGLHGASIKVWKVHRAGIWAGDIKGADLYYEIDDKKFVLVQYKTPDKRDRVNLDKEQLDELVNACPIDCPPSKRFGCGSWYLIRTKDDREYFPACEARKIFGRNNSRYRRFFINGLVESQFMQDFGACQIGARTKPIDVSEYREWSVANDYVFVSAVRNDNDAN